MFNCQCEVFDSLPSQCRYTASNGYRPAHLPLPTLDRLFAELGTAVHSLFSKSITCMITAKSQLLVLVSVWPEYHTLTNP